jgi:hypothetical protein
MKALLISCALILSVKSLASDWQREYKMIESSPVQNVRGQIYVIGTVHETRTEATTNAPVPDVVLRARRGYIEHVNATSNANDIVFYEGAYYEVRQAAPSRSIVSQVSGTQVVQATFNKSLYLLGWEDLITVAIAEIAERIQLQSYKLGNSTPEAVAKLRAQYFYLKVVWAERNQKLLQLLREAVANTPRDKNIYLLIGGGHLYDPRFIAGIGRLGPSYAIYQNRNVNVDISHNFLALKDALAGLRVNPLELDSIFSTVYEHLNRYRSLTQKDYESIRSKIYGHAYASAFAQSCRSPLVD